MEITQREVDEIAVKVFNHFNELSKSGKPVASKEWTCLSAFLLRSKQDKTLKIVSLATGTRCLGQSQLDSTGCRLNDSHSEVLSRRAFAKYLLTEIRNVYENKPSEVLVLEGQLVGVKPDVEVIFFSTQTPCGDGSIFARPDGDIHPKRKRRANLSHTGKRRAPTEDDNDNPCKSLKSEVINSAINDSQDGGNGSEKLSPIPSSPTDIYRTGAKCVPGGQQDSLDDGCSYHVTSILRVKPGRGNPTQSHCCSDKMARWNILGCQGCLPMLFLRRPVYIDSIILAGCTYDRSSLERALFGRLENLTVDHPDYQLMKPQIMYSPLRFSSSREQLESGAISSISPCSSSIVYFLNGQSNVKEVVVNGYRQGVTNKARQSDKARLSVCRFEIMRIVIDILKSLPNHHPLADLASKGLSYDGLKCQTVYHSLWSQLKATGLFSLWLTKDSSFSTFKIS